MTTIGTASDLLFCFRLAGKQFSLTGHLQLSIVARIMCLRLFDCLGIKSWQLNIPCFICIFLCLEVSRWSTVQNFVNFLKSLLHRSLIYGFYSLCFFWTICFVFFLMFFIYCAVLFWFLNLCVLQQHWYRQEAKLGRTVEKPRQKRCHAPRGLVCR